MSFYGSKEDFKKKKKKAIRREKLYRSLTEMIEIPASVNIEALIFV